jgi:hypothetical protein
MCVFFFVPFYIFNNFLLAFGSVAISHGLQYLIYLMFYKKISDFKDIKKLISRTLILIIIILIAHNIWSNAQTLNYINYIPIINLTDLTLDYKIGTSLLFGMTIAHFVFDQYFWRFRKNSNINIIKCAYPFILKQSNTLQNAKS